MSDRAMAQITSARAGWALLVAALLLAPWLFYPLFLVKVLCYAMFACAFNLLLGTCGLMSFGHAAFFGSAAYIAGHAAKVWGLPFEASLLCAVAGSSLVGVVFAVVVIGGLGSILGSIVTSLVLGLLEGLARVVYPQGANMVIFVIMIAVLLVRPAGLFGRER